MTIPSKQQSSADALLHAINALVAWDLTDDKSNLDVESLNTAAKELDQVKSKDRKSRRGVEVRVGATFREAIRGLDMDRCDLLTMSEVTALMGLSERGAERHVSDYIKTHREGEKPGDGDYHSRTTNPNARKYWKWFYHLAPFDTFLDGLEDQEFEKRRTAGLNQRYTPGALARRKLAVEAERRDIDLVSAVVKDGHLDLKKVPAADHPLLKKARAQMAALDKTLGRMGVSLADLVGLQTFALAQVADITTSVVVRQPWLVDVEGRLTDHAWWAIDNDAESIRADLVAGGTVVHMPLVEALEREWRSGDAYAVWSAIADMAAVRSMESRRRHLAAMRHERDEGKGEGLPVKGRIRSS